MRKSHPFNALSAVHFCRKCGKAIKQRLVEQKREVPKLCYSCYEVEEKRRRGQKSS